MSIQHQPGQRPLVPSPPPTWGELMAEDDDSGVVRFVLVDRIVTYPYAELKRWEHIAGEPERLLISAGRERIVIEGTELTAIRAALDKTRLCEVRINNERSKARPGPRVRRIAIEST